MNQQLIAQVGKKFMKKVPVVKPGCTVRIHQKIKEGSKERIQIFEGLVIAVSSGNGPSKTMTVRKVVGGIGVEKIFPIYSTNIAKIQVTKSSTVIRAKLYFMRKRSGKSARLREKHLREEDVVMEDIEGVGVEEAPEEEVNEEVAEATTDEATEAPESSVEEKPEEEAPKQDEAPTEEEKAEEAAPEEEKPAEEETPAEEEPKADESAEAPAEEEVPAEEEKKPE